MAHTLEQVTAFDNIYTERSHVQYSCAHAARAHEDSSVSNLLLSDLLTPQ
jgi:hypothetical protein